MNRDNTQKIKDLLNHPHGEKSIIRTIVDVLGDDNIYSRLVNISLIRVYIDKSKLLSTESWKVERKADGSVFGVYEQNISGYPVLIYLAVNVSHPSKVAIQYGSFYTRLKNESKSDLICPMVFKDLQESIEDELRIKHNIGKGASSDVRNK